MNQAGNITDEPSRPTGDEIMSAARGALADEFPAAAPTASGHANKLAGRIFELLGDKAED